MRGSSIHSSSLMNMCSWIWEWTSTQMALPTATLRAFGAGGCAATGAGPHFHDLTIDEVLDPVGGCSPGEGVRLVDGGTITCGVADPFASRIHDTAPYRPCANMKALVAG
ncbi:MAG: hypothetical protein DHS20C03_20740 [Minwuia thermotolerans]|nr:MAG: hypothetical protein DHS20C03_20740 [Minwuia thermotolerans]